MIIALIVASGSLSAQEKKLTVGAGADLVSSYVWRGMYQTGVSIQPSLSLSAYGVTLGSWGSTDFSTSAKELDFYLSYQIKGLSVGVTDYWWSGEGSSYFNDRGSHYLEANIGYTFTESFPLSLSVNTMLYGHGDRDTKDKQQYSTYISVAYPFTIDDTDCQIGVGVSPSKGMYSKDFNVANITARATKNLQISQSYVMPIFVEAIFSPTKDNAYLVLGVKF